ncbi:hypothetical protein [Leptodesmis sp.]|uniref:hypothetical protein n=1 Tax=Leptodesmis sp. TaxID=3100501 RepID=UPI0040534EAC
MQTSQPYSGPITLVISEIVESDRIQEYEAWTRGINQAAQKFAGFLGVETIRPRDRNHPEYAVIVDSIIMITSESGQSLLPIGTGWNDRTIL